MIESSTWRQFLMTSATVVKDDGVGNRVSPSILLLELRHDRPAPLSLLTSLHSRLNRLISRHVVGETGKFGGLSG
jgi:hypothetical protein